MMEIVIVDGKVTVDGTEYEPKRQPEVTLTFPAGDVVYGVYGWPYLRTHKKRFVKKGECYLGADYNIHTALQDSDVPREIVLPLSTEWLEYAESHYWR